MSGNIIDNLVIAQDRQAREAVAGDNLAKLDLFNLVLGEVIGQGVYRTVFEFPLNMKWVIKYEHNMMSNNAIEYDIWSTMDRRGKKYSKWFAPCVAMSGCTKFLIMERTSHVLHWPDKIPKMLNDFHTGNFGMLGKRFVSHDYGNTVIMRDKCDLLKMKKAKWRT